MTNSKKVGVSCRLLTPDHTPYRHQEVVVKQLRHKFLFGTALFDLVPFVNGEYSGLDRELSQLRIDKALGLCNAVTLPFYWAGFEPRRGEPRITQLKLAAQWSVDHNLRVKGHPLCWHTLAPDWLLPLSNAEILQMQIARIRREVSEFRGLIDMWDAINEAVIMPIFEKYDNGLTRICKELGRIKTIKTMFETARSVNPSAVFLINDFETSPAYDILIEGCLEAGIKIDVIGIQSHMHQGWWGIEKTQEILERFSRFNIPLHFTETTLVSGHLMPPEIVDLNDYQVTNWITTPEGEERQAREVVAHYQTLFSHPLVQSITWWDIYDGCWLNAPSGLLRADGSSKPAYDELQKLVKGEWWLQPTTMITDDDGCIQVSGYEGDYEVISSGRHKTFMLDKDIPQLELIL